MENNRIILENEKNANRVAAKVMLISFLIFSLIYVLNVLGIFIVDQTVMTIAYLLGSAMLIAPTIIITVLNVESPYIKWINVTITVIFIIVLSTTLTFHVVVLYVYPIAIANLYFSKKLNIFATVSTVVGVSIGQILAFELNTLPDKNFPTLWETMLFSVLPRMLVLIAVSAIFTMLSNRTASLFSNFLDKEDELKTAYNEMVMGFATLVESKDGSTGGHIKRISGYAKLLAEELHSRGIYREQITDSYIENLCHAAPMHDIGKVCVPDVILQKPGKLTDEEFEVIKQHTTKGGQIINETFGHLDNEEYTKMAYDVAVYHHEKWNGKGYPQGLKQTEIPLCARIISIADVFDALSEDRCYRAAMTMDKCFEIIKNSSGTDFDPVLVDTFLDIRIRVEQLHNQTTETAI